MASIIKNKILELEGQGFKRKKLHDEEDELSKTFVMKTFDVRKKIIADKINKTIKIETKSYKSPMRIRGYTELLIVEEKPMTIEEIKAQNIMEQYKSIVVKEPKLEKY